MKWVSCISQGFIEVSGQRYDLSHMRGPTFELAIAATARFPALTLRIEVEFTSHCVSFGPKEGETLDFDALGQDRRILDHRQVARAFCFDRYRWSLSLPTLVRTLDGHFCNFTGQGNWLVIRAIDDQGREVDYEIYFRLRRHDKDALRMVVESAYVRALGTPGPGVPHDRKGRIRFQVMAAKVFRGEPLRDPSHNRR
ncbi:hypothetical protein [Parapusillimonas granuli]|uniref:Uncharacterized protein n=1 Tax=Parapusillimonas granuli TaxID=380911 RepID=A0A853G3K5_9BURK|nr:hypothetical protein [Parapusillimonas granuli]MBB5217318.1 hypothetical protein [Parapusillimonas granuli]NYT50889.1 hypothetical protein [Parapusillimonas granuli]